MESTADILTAKTKLILVFFAAITSFIIVETAEALFIIFCLGCIDVFTGILKANYIGQEIVSKKLRHKMLDFSGQSMMVFTSALVAFLYPGISPITTAIIMYFVGREFLSIRENLKAIGIALPANLDAKIDAALNLNKKVV